MLKTAVYRDFRQLPKGIVDACSYPAQQNWFLTLDWFECLYETSLSTELSLRAYAATTADDELRGLLVCGEGERRLRSLSNYYSLSYAPCIFGEPESPEPVTDALIGAIAAERPRFPIVDFRLLDPKSELTECLAKSLRKHGFAPTRYFQFENWYCRTGGVGFDEFYAARPSKLRNTIRRKERSLQKSSSIDIRIITEAGPELEAGIRDYVAVYNRSWKREEPFPDFIPRLAEVCARLGILRLGVLSIDGAPAAAQFWINTPSCALIYKLAYDEQFKKQSVGSILSRELFRHALDVDRVEEIDYGVGSEGYKRDWMDSVRRLEAMRSFNLKTLSGAGMAAVHAAKRAVRTVVRRDRSASD